MTTAPAKRPVRRQRADALVLERGLADSRAKAQAMILAGELYAGDRCIDKPGTLVSPDEPLRITPRRRFVSRGGDKLLGALEAFGPLGLSPEGLHCLDVGASTGGFTDCLLQRGATSVVAVDVGYGQLADKLRADPRVDVRERTHAKDLRRDDFAHPVDLAVVDASFIGIDRLVGPIAGVLRPGGALVALVKPQFEAGREAARKGRGVIRDEATRLAAIDKGRRAIEAAGFHVIGEVDSAVRGPKGNLERFVYARLSMAATD